VWESDHTIAVVRGLRRIAREVGVGVGTVLRVTGEIGRLWRLCTGGVQGLVKNPQHKARPRCG